MLLFLMSAELVIYVSTRWFNALVSRINSDTQVIQDCLSTNVSMFVRGTVFILATLAILFIISPVLAGSTLAAILPILIFAAIYG